MKASERDREHGRHARPAQKQGIHGQGIQGPGGQQPNTQALTPPERASSVVSTPRVSGARPLIEGAFTYDSLPDLFRFLCARQQSLEWQLVTLAGTFTLLFEQGQPVDIIFRPVRPTGARVGTAALRILFRQEGGRFRVDQGAPPAQRRTLSGGGENLLIEMATLDDEKTAPNVLAGVSIDTSAELAVVADLPPDEHRTAFSTRAPEVPLLDVLQLFSVSRRAYRLRVAHVADPQTDVGHLDVGPGVVLAAVAGALHGEAALFSLLSTGGALDIEVSPLPDGRDAPPLGKLDALLIKALMQGHLQPDGATQAPAAPTDRMPADPGPTEAAPPAPARRPETSLLGRLRQSLSRK